MQNYIQTTTNRNPMWGKTGRACWEEMMPEEVLTHQESGEWKIAWPWLEKTHIRDWLTHLLLCDSRIIKSYWSDGIVGVRTEMGTQYFMKALVDVSLLAWRSSPKSLEEVKWFHPHNCLVWKTLLFLPLSSRANIWDGDSPEVNSALRTSQIGMQKLTSQRSL